jgi:hypothetical protein
MGFHYNTREWPLRSIVLIAAGLVLATFSLFLLFGDFGDTGTKPRYMIFFGISFGVGALMFILEGWNYSRAPNNSRPQSRNSHVVK